MNFTAQLMKEALTHLAQKLPHTIQLIVGGGGAMILAHGFPLSTTDLDGIPRGMTLSELDPLVKKVALELNIASDWLNPYFATFTHVLPEDYGSRLHVVFSAKNLEVLALSKEDLLIMKCFAGRQKDIPHAQVLVKKSINLKIVEDQLEKLVRQKIPGAIEATDFLDEILDD